jgi:hypothetical protein
VIKRVIGAVKEGRGTVHEQLGDPLLRYAAPEQGGDDAAHQVALSHACERAELALGPH